MSLIAVDYGNSELNRYQEINCLTALVFTYNRILHKKKKKIAVLTQYTDVRRHYS